MTVASGTVRFDEALGESQVVLTLVEDRYATVTFAEPVTEAVQGLGGVLYRTQGSAAAGFYGETFPAVVGPHIFVMGPIGSGNDVAFAGCFFCLSGPGPYMYRGTVDIMVSKA